MECKYCSSIMRDLSLTPIIGNRVYFCDFCHVFALAHFNGELEWHDMSDEGQEEMDRFQSYHEMGLSTF